MTFVASLISVEFLCCTMTKHKSNLSWNCLKSCDLRYILFFSQKSQHDRLASPEEEGNKKIYWIFCLVQNSEGNVYTSAELEAMDLVFHLKMPTHILHHIKILEFVKFCRCNQCGAGYTTTDKNTVYICE